MSIVKNSLFAFLMICTVWISSESVAKTKQAILTLKNFPLEVGSQWVYARVDSSSSGFFPEGVTKQVVMDTVTVKIVGQTKAIEGHFVSILVREFRSKVDTQQYISLIGAERPKFRDSLHKTDTCIQQALITPNVYAVDSQYVTVVGDTVVFAKRIRISTDTTKPLYGQELFRLVFPLVSGNTWKGAYPDDSFTISHKESIEVIQNESKPGFLVKRISSIPNSYGETASWIVSGVGLVRRENRHLFTFGDVIGVERWRLIRYEVKK